MNWQKQLGVEILSRKKATNLIGNSDHYYVYIIWKMYTDKPLPFYVGKGHWQRLIKHEMQSEFHRNSYKTNIILKHEKLGFKCGYSIIKFFEDEEDAYNAEKDLIQLIGRYDLNEGPLTNRTDGGDGSRGHLAPRGGDSASARPVYAKGTRYSCLKDAGTAHKIEPGSIVARIKNGWEGYYYEDEGQRPQVKNILGRYKKKVVVEGKNFESASEASRQLKIDVRMISKRIKYGWDGYYYIKDGQLPRKTIWSDRKDKVTVIIKGQRYETVADAVRETGESMAMISKRCLSSNYPEYSRLDGKVVKKSKEPVVPEKVWVDGKLYESISETSKATNLTTGGVAHRCKSSNYPDWRFEDQSKQDNESFVAPFSSIPIKVVINGIEFSSQSEAAHFHEIDINTLKKRCRSLSFPKWTSNNIEKQQPKDNRPGLINIQIDDITYRSISEASRKLSISRALIKSRVSSDKYTNYINQDC